MYMFVVSTEDDMSLLIVMTCWRTYSHGFLRWWWCCWGYHITKM